MLNNICYQGYVLDQPEKRRNSNGNTFLHFTLKQKKRFGDDKYDYVDVIIGNEKRAAFFEDKLYRGRNITVEGELHFSKNEKDGKKYYNPYIQANNIHFNEWPTEEKN